MLYTVWSSVALLASIIGWCCIAVLRSMALCKGSVDCVVALHSASCFFAVWQRHGVSSCCVGGLLSRGAVRFCITTLLRWLAESHSGQNNVWWLLHYNVCCWGTT